MRRKAFVLIVILVQGVLFLGFLFRHTFPSTLDFLILLSCLLFSLVLSLVQAKISKRLIFREPLSWVGVILPILFQLGFYLFMYHTNTPTLAYPLFALLFVGILYVLEQGMLELRGYLALPSRNTRILLNTITLLTGFCFYFVLLTARYDTVIEFIITVLITFLLFFQSMLWWTKRQVLFSLYQSIILAAITGQVVWAMQFLPHTPFVVALLLTTFQHCILGIVHNHCKGQLTYRIVTEYIVMGLFIASCILATSQWFPLYT